jgi:hypothetical protein
MEVPRGHGDLVTCPGCGGKDWEIRMGGLGSRPPASVTCAGCLGMWWLKPSSGSRDPLMVAMVPVTAEVAAHPGIRSLPAVPLPGRVCLRD